MILKIKHYKNPNEISEYEKIQMLNLVQEVYDEETRNDFLQELNGKIIYQYINIFNGDELVALGTFCESGLDFDTYSLAWGMVKEKYRGQGLGKILLEKRIEIIRNNGGKKILGVTKTMWHFERCGFKTIYAFSDGDHLMCLEL